jgi:hypothetical protein
LPYAFFSSPAWWNYSLPASVDDRAAIGIVESPDGATVGVVPVRIQEFCLDYSIRAFRLAKSRLRTVALLGYEPMIPYEDGVFLDLIQSILDSFGDCDGIYLEWVSFDSDCWKTIFKSGELRRTVLVYAPRKLQGCHYIDLSGSYDQYLARFTPKYRSNLRRQVRRLRDHGEGRLDFLRIEHESDVPYFLEAGSELARRSRVYRNTGWNVLENTLDMRQKLGELARRGVLRSYLLRCGEEVCAFVKGYQYNNIYYSMFIGFDEQFVQFSPGTMLHFMVVEDLHAHRPLRRMNLGAGQWSYLDDLATGTDTGTAVLLLRRSVANRLRVDTHAALRWSIDFVRGAVAKTHRTDVADETDHH